MLGTWSELLHRYKLRCYDDHDGEVRCSVRALGGRMLLLSIALGVAIYDLHRSYPRNDFCGCTECFDHDTAKEQVLVEACLESVANLELDCSSILVESYRLVCKQQDVLEQEIQDHFLTSNLASILCIQHHRVQQDDSRELSNHGRVRNGIGHGSCLNDSLGSDHHLRGTIYLIHLGQIF